jgi:hypothetical protein
MLEKVKFIFVESLNLCNRVHKSEICAFAFLLLPWFDTFIAKISRP